MGELTVESRALVNLRAHPRNYRRHPDSQIAVLRDSLRIHGQQKPVVIQPDGTILAGHALVEAARAEGWSVISCHVYNGPHPEQFLVMDNRSSALAEDDAAELLALLNEAKAADILGATGFDDPALMALLAEVNAAQPKGDGFDVEKAMADPAAAGIVTRVQRGEVWQCGRHRVMCGDSAKREDLAALMGNARAGLLATDPPYGVSYSDIAASRPAAGYVSPDRGRIANDDLHDAALQSFLESVFQAVLPYLNENAAWYLWHAQKTQGYFTAAAAAAAAVIYHRQIVWVKPSLILGRGDYHWRHELCLYGWRQGHRPPWLAGRDQDTVWEIGTHDGAAETEDHPTPKPLALWERPIQNHLQPGEALLDCFLGSAPALIAAERLGRVCYGMDLEPRYCDVAIARWEAETGESAVRVERQKPAPAPEPEPAPGIFHHERAEVRM